MSRPDKQRGFTLIEVLVALAIIAVALSAATRVAGLMTTSNGLLRDRSVALLAAHSRLAQTRLEGVRAGNSRFECDQGRLQLRCEQSVRAAGDGLMAIELQVLDRTHEAPPLARLSTVVSP